MSVFGSIKNPLARAWWRITEVPPTQENLLRLCEDDRDVQSYLRSREQGNISIEEAAAVLILWRVSRETDVNLLEDIYSAEELWVLALDVMLDDSYWEYIHKRLDIERERTQAYKEEASKYAEALIRFGHYRKTPQGYLEPLLR